jgi:hypothetical protein
LDSVSDIVFVACVNVLLADVTSDSRDPRDYDAELLVLRVAVVSILAHGVHALLVPQREAEQ